MTYDRPLVSFDWAIKKLLRNKADHVIVEGFLTSLLGNKIKISALNESEANKETFDDKYNRVDIFCESEAGELMILEIQYDDQSDYFHRMTFGVSRSLSEYLREGDPYSKLRKIYSINIVYFDLGQGDDYAYHGKTEFVSLHDSTKVLSLSEEQKELYDCKTPGDIMPEYYILKVNNFNDVATTPLEEWISYLKTDAIPKTAKAPGLAEARERLLIDQMSPSERKKYYLDRELKRHRLSEIETSLYKGLRQGRAEGRKEGEKIGIEKERQKAYQEKLDMAHKMKADGMPYDIIIKYSGLSIDEIEKL
ncbi:MAG: Rpn family recombination-promoting nuclease/putative transposase [Bacteroidales bacterium]|nr:Rpn family recombination-promoting nuclease/putative transposase [Bacteroidales bacterium]